MHKGLDRADIDNASFAREQGFEERVRDVEGAVQVGRHDVLPVFQHRTGIGGESVAAVDARIVDQDRYLSDLVRDLFRDSDAVLAPGLVERKTFRLSSGAAYFLRGLGLYLPVDF